MIQRKQSLFLFLAVVLLVAGTFCISTSFVDDSGNVAAKLSNFSFVQWDVASCLCSLHHTMVDVCSKTTNCFYSVLGVMLLIPTIISAATIFLYKNRRMQMRLCLWSIFVLLVYYVTRICCIVSIAGKLHLSWGVNVFDAFPLVAFILIVMARAAINKDDRLVRAADRIR